MPRNQPEGHRVETSVLVDHDRGLVRVEKTTFAPHETLSIGGEEFDMTDCEITETWSTGAATPPPPRWDEAAESA